MWVRLERRDVRIIAHYTGVLVAGIGVAMLVPLITALITREWAVALDYVLGMGVAFVAGLLLMYAAPRGEALGPAQALIVAAVGWLAASFVAAVPLSLSGNYLSYLDALFDALSGLTTSGLTLVTDIDHMAFAHNMWRHLTHLIGGQGIIVAALSVAIGLRGGSISLYVAEGRDEKILPNVVHTTRFIWFVTAVYVSLGTMVLWIVNSSLGMSAVRGSLHAFWMTIAAYDTGGFGPQSMNAMYYHSWVFELVLVLLMIAGTLNFNLHADMWRGDRKEILRNIESRTIAANVVLLTIFTALALAAGNAYDTGWEVVRKGAFHVLSANTGTGHQTIYAAQWARNYGGLATVAVMLAMAFGGMVSSTAGGIKAMRIGIIIKSIIQRIRESLAPRSAVIEARYHHLMDRNLNSEVVNGALTLFFLYVVTYVTGGLIGAAYGYSAGESLFESISAAANVGLSTGITNPAMPVALKIVYIVQMWAGRLEFVAVFALIASAVLRLRARLGRERG